MCFVVTCWERADLLALVCGVFCEFVTFPLVSWVRCGTWLYRFLIFATLLTFLVFRNKFVNVFLYCLLHSVRLARFVGVLLRLFCFLAKWYFLQAVLQHDPNQGLSFEFFFVSRGWECCFTRIFENERNPFNYFFYVILTGHACFKWVYDTVNSFCVDVVGKIVSKFIIPFRYSVLFTVESLSLLHLLVISWFICFRRWCIDKLGVFHANQISMCLGPHLK